MPQKAETTPVTVAVNSPEFNEAVAAAVARVIAGSQIPMPGEAGFVPRPQTVAATSVDTSQPGPDDLTVRFTRFCTFLGCGYQRGQEAGFPRSNAEELARSGAALIVYDPRRHV